MVEIKNLTGKLQRKYNNQFKFALLSTALMKSRSPDSSVVDTALEFITKLLVLNPKFSRKIDEKI